MSSALGWKLKEMSSNSRNSYLVYKVKEAVLTVCSKYRSVCIAQDGLPVLDDVGGLNGFIQFLKGINQKGRKKEERDDDWGDEYGLYRNKHESLERAKSLGWSKRKISNKNLL